MSDPSPAAGDGVTPILPADSADEIPFDIDIASTPEHTVVTVSGEVDVFTAPRLRQVLFDPVLCARPRIVLDLDRVVFMDSTGVGALVAARRWAISRDTTLALVCCPGGRVHRLLELVGLVKVFEIHTTVEAAAAG